MTTNNAVNTTLLGQTGTGTFAGSTSPTFVTPVLGVAAATSINFGESTLANYVSESSWTPAFTFITPGNLSVSYATQTGTYTRIGSMVYFTFQLVFTPTFTTSSGNAAITGIPINTSSSAGFITAPCQLSGVIFTGSFVTLSLPSGNNYMQFLQSISNVGFSNLTTTSFLTATQYSVNGTGFYFV